MTFSLLSKIVLSVVVFACASVSQAQKNASWAWNDLKEIDGKLNTKPSGSCVEIGSIKLGSSMHPTFKNRCDFPVTVAWCYATQKYKPNCFGNPTGPLVFESLLPRGWGNPILETASYYGSIWLDPGQMAKGDKAPPSDELMIGDREKGVKAAVCANPKEKLAMLYPASKEKRESGGIARPIPSGDFLNSNNVRCEIGFDNPPNFLITITSKMN